MLPFEKAYQVLKNRTPKLHPSRNDPRTYFDRAYTPILMDDWGEDDYGGRDEVEERHLPQILRDWRGDRSGKIGHGANRYALVGDKTVEKIPQNYGYAQDKTSLAMINALASLGYPILPERPIATNNPRFFPTEQEKVDMSFRDYLEPFNMHESLEDWKEHKRAFGNDLRALDREAVLESPLGLALDLGDIIQNDENVGYKDGKLVAIDPFVGNFRQIENFGRTLHSAAQPVWQSQKGPASENYGEHARQPGNTHALRRRRRARELYQDFKDVDPMQLDSFTQLYHDQEQFKPWDAAEQKLLDNPSAFGEYEPNPTQREQLEMAIGQGRDNYRAAGNALQWMNTPPEQKRLYEFGDDEHARRYRFMLDSLNRT